MLEAVWDRWFYRINGNFYKIPKSIIGPKPIQKPHPKILLGGFSPKTFESMVKYGDGYIGYIEALVGGHLNTFTIQLKCLILLLKKVQELERSLIWLFFYKPTSFE